eukprot:461611-Rhodomonas_salina.1
MHKVVSGSGVDRVVSICDSSNGVQTLRQTSWRLAAVSGLLSMNSNEEEGESLRSGEESSESEPPSAAPSFAPAPRVHQLATQRLKRAGVTQLTV